MNRVDFHHELENILKSKNVYFQSPPTVLMKYPAIRYSLDDVEMDYADNSIYRMHKKFNVTVIDSNPDSTIPFDILKHFQYSTFVRFYTADTLNHWNIYIYC